MLSVFFDKVFVLVKVFGFCVFMDDADYYLKFIYLLGCSGLADQTGTGGRHKLQDNFSEQKPRAQKHFDCSCT